MQNKTEALKEQVLAHERRQSAENVCAAANAPAPARHTTRWNIIRISLYIWLKRGDIETLMKSESIYKCLSCFACVDRCPSGVEPAKLVEALRLAADPSKGRKPYDSGRYSRKA